MADTSALTDCINALEATLGELNRIARRSDADRKRDLVAMRRILSERIGMLPDAATQPGAPFADPPLSDEFQARFSKMRSAVALHQATWSVVLIDDAPDSYRASAAHATATTRDFILWARAALTSNRS